MIEVEQSNADKQESRVFRKDLITGRHPPFLIGPPQQNKPFLFRYYRRNRPKRVSTLEDGLIKTVMNREESSPKETSAESPK